MPHMLFVIAVWCSSMYEAYCFGNSKIKIVPKYQNLQILTVKGIWSDSCGCG